MSSIFLTLLVGIWPFGHHPQTETKKYLIPAWHVDATRDRFDHQMVCRVYQGRRKKPLVSFERETVAFRFSSKINTTKAEFRLDDAPAQPWTSVYPSLIGSGATLSGRSLTNPTSGLVILPVKLLQGVATVTIRARPDDRPRWFSVLGLGEALASAQRLGCDRSYGFTRPNN